MNPASFPYPRLLQLYVHGDSVAATSEAAAQQFPELADLARLEAGSFSLRVHRQDFAEFIAAEVDAFSAYAAAKDIEIGAAPELRPHSIGKTNTSTQPDGLVPFAAHRPRLFLVEDKEDMRAYPD